ncbi:collagen type IV alpha-3-binding protein-like protein, partial [Aphelenchoides avenae]
MNAKVDESSLMADVRRVRAQEVKKLKAGLDLGGWELFVEDKALKMYRMDKKIDGVPCDPIIAVHTVKGVSAWEYIDVFFQPQHKPHWD